MGEKQARKEKRRVRIGKVIQKDGVGGPGGAVEPGATSEPGGGSRSRNKTGAGTLQLELFWRESELKNQLFYFLGGGSESASAMSEQAGSPGTRNPQAVCVSASRVPPKPSWEHPPGQAAAAPTAAQ